jgi:hypothetical protein
LVQWYTKMGYLCTTGVPPRKSGCLGILVPTFYTLPKIWPDFLLKPATVLAFEPGVDVDEERSIPQPGTETLPLVLLFVEALREGEVL